MDNPGFLGYDSCQLSELTTVALEVTLKKVLLAQSSVLIFRFYCFLFFNTEPVENA